MLAKHKNVAFPRTSRFKNALCDCLCILQHFLSYVVFCNERFCLLQREAIVVAKDRSPNSSKDKTLFSNRPKSFFSSSNALSDLDLQELVRIDFLNLIFLLPFELLSNTLTYYVKIILCKESFVASQEQTILAILMGLLPSYALHLRRRSIETNDWSKPVDANGHADSSGSLPLPDPAPEEEAEDGGDDNPPGIPNGAGAGGGGGDGGGNGHGHGAAFGGEAEDMVIHEDDEDEGVEDDIPFAGVFDPAHNKEPFDLASSALPETLEIPLASSPAPAVVTTTATSREIVGLAPAFVYSAPQDSESVPAAVVTTTASSREIVGLAPAFASSAPQDSESVPAAVVTTTASRREIVGLVPAFASSAPQDLESVPDLGSVPAFVSTGLAVDQSILREESASSQGKLRLGVSTCSPSLPTSAMGETEQISAPRMESMRKEEKPEKKRKIEPGSPESKRHRTSDVEEPPE